MAKSQETWNKKEAEKKKEKKRKEKEQKKEERKANKGGNSLDDMMAYVDEYGNITSTPPDPTKKIKVNEEDIQISIPKHEDGPKGDGMRTGTVTFFNESKGYGFIKDKDTQESIFVHVKSLIDPIKENSRVTYKVEKSPKGLSAVEVTLVK
ncbi:MAG: cold shock domain-containing protein [Cytophagaceae bacterium]|nr:cold shock domain-containing protein [Cytophagaceae bacterium]